MLIDCLQNRKQAFSQKNRSAAAKVDAVHRLSSGGSISDRTDQLGNILIDKFLIVGKGIKITVGTFGKAEGNVKIDAERIHVKKLLLAVLCEKITSQDREVIWMISR